MSRAGKNTPASVLAFIDAHLDRVPDPRALAVELGYDSVAIHKLEQKHGERLLTYLQGVQRGRVDRDKFLARQQGRRPQQLRQYVESAQGAIDDAAVVDPASQDRIIKRSRAEVITQVQADIAAMEKVRASLDELLKERPHLTSTIGRELWQIRGRIEAAKKKLKRHQVAARAA